MEDHQISIQCKGIIAIYFLRIDVAILESVLECRCDDEGWIRKFRRFCLKIG